MTAAKCTIPWDRDYYGEKRKEPVTGRQSAIESKFHYVLLLYDGCAVAPSRMTAVGAMHTKCFILLAVNNFGDARLLLT